MKIEWLWRKESTEMVIRTHAVIFISLNSNFPIDDEISIRLVSS